MPLLEATNIVKRYANTPVLRSVSVSAEAGEIIALLGPSGCGKTTLLRIIAGLESADEGMLAFDGRRIDGQAAHQRGFGLMFQDYALFPHRNVADNIAFGLRMQGYNRQFVRSADYYSLSARMSHYSSILQRKYDRCSCLPTYIFFDKQHTNCPVNHEQSCADLDNQANDNLLCYQFVS